MEEVSDFWEQACLLGDMNKGNTKERAESPIKDDDLKQRADWLNSSDDDRSDWVLKATDNNEENRCLLSESEEEDGAAIIHSCTGPCSLETRQSWITFDEERLEAKPSLEQSTQSLSITTAPSPTLGVHGSDLHASVSWTDIPLSRQSSLRSGICHVSDSESLNYIFKDTSSAETPFLTRESSTHSGMGQSNDVGIGSDMRLGKNNEMMNRAPVLNTNDEKKKKKKNKVFKIMKLFGRLSIKRSRRKIMPAARVRSANSALIRCTSNPKTTEDNSSSEDLLGCDDTRQENEAVAYSKKSSSEKVLSRLLFRFKKSKKRDSSKQTRFHGTPSFEQT